MKDRSLLKFFVDLILWSLSLPAAYFLRLEEQTLYYIQDIAILFLIAIPIKSLIIYLFGFHRQSWHNFGVRDIYRLSQGLLIPFLILTICSLTISNIIFIPLSVPLISVTIALILLGFARFLVRIKYENSGILIAERSKSLIKRVLIIGAGDAGNMLLREIYKNPKVKMNPIGMLDDDNDKQKTKYMGVPVLGKLADLPLIVNSKNIDLVLIAMPTAPGKVIRYVVELAKASEVEFQIMPGLYELISNKFNLTKLRVVDVHDLLRRDHIELDLDSVSGYLQNKTILVTGAGGSIGSEIVRQITKCKPDRVLLLGRGENSIFKIETECRQIFPELDFISLITDVKDIESLEKVFSKYLPQVVFHAAAHKHVSLMENNPAQAVFNNVGGTRNMVNMALKYRVERFVNISSDKSVNPTSVMGASKRVAEFLVEWGSCRAEKGQEFVSVRFGNVLGSRGSVVPLFKQQIENGGPITITHPDMTRYFMTIPEASQLVIQAGGLGGNGAVYVLDMGEPVRIVDLANDLIRLSGMTPGEDIEIVYTGVRPGEKMFEELLTDEENTTATHYTKIFAAKTSGFPKENFETLLDELFEIAHKNNGMAIREHLKVLIPTFEYEAQKINV